MPAEPEPVGTIGDTRVEVWDGDLTALSVDAIVNAANNEGWLGSGVAGAIRRAAGDEVEREALAQAPWPVGEAVRTGAGLLGQRGVGMILHAAAMSPGRPATADAVRSSVAGALALASAAGAGSIAIPAIGAGVGGLSVPESVCAIAEALLAHCSGPTSLRRVTVALLGPPATLAASRTMAERLAPGREPG